MFVLEHPGKLTMEARARILEDFRRGIEENGVVLLLDGMTCKQYTTEEGEELKVVEYTLLEKPEKPTTEDNGFAIRLPIQGHGL